jgi:NTE family protein
MPNALVVSGGGSKGAFAVGAIEKLREHNITFDMVAGSSTGALIAPLVVTDEIELLRTIYSSIRTEDILRQRDPIEILTKDAIYDTHPLWSLLHSFLTDERYRKIIASPIELYITTVNLQSGQIAYWNQHTSGPGGSPVSRQTLIRAVMASASQPVLMPSVAIEDSGDQYVDGGVREIAPLKVTIDHGATDAYAIVLSPEQRQRSDETYAFVVKTLLRTLDLVLQEIVTNDVNKAVLYNQAVRYLTALRAKAASFLPAEQVAAIFDDPQNPNPFADKRLLNLHVIRPAEELPSGGLEFRPLVMSQMMEMGYQAAQRALEEGHRTIV